MNVQNNAQPHGEAQSSGILGSQVLAGLSGRGAEYVEGSDERLLLGLFSASSSTSFTATEVRHVAERTIEAALLRPVTGAADLLLDEVGHDIHVALRRTFSPSPPSALGTVVLAAIDAKNAMFLWTANGAAYLLREGQPPVHLEGNGLGPEEGSPDLTLVRPEWELQPGDRIVVATRHLSEWFDDETLADVAGAGLVESAAQTLGAVADVRSGGAEVAIAVFEIASTEAASEIDAGGADYADMLEGLAGVLPKPRLRKLPHERTPIHALQRERGIVEPSFDDSLTPYEPNPVPTVDPYSTPMPEERLQEPIVAADPAPVAAPNASSRLALVIGISFVIGIGIGIALFL